jgi:hypothetical protein
MEKMTFLPKLNPILRHLSVILYVCTQVVFTHAAESGFWEERRKSRSLIGSTYAALPTSSLPGMERVTKNLGTLSASLHSSISNLGGHAPLSHVIRAIPHELGSIRNIFPPQSPENPIVVLLQDVHWNIDAQRNLSRLIQELSSFQWKDGKSTEMVLALEGAFGAIDISAFRNYGHPTILRRVADRLLLDRRIAGPLHGLLSGEKIPARIVGVDDRRHYQSNVMAYRTAIPHQKSLRNQLFQKRREFVKRQNTVFSKGLKSFDYEARSYHEGKKSLSHYSRILASTYSGNKQTFARENPTLSIFLQAVEMESSLDFNRVERERGQWLNQLTHFLSAEGRNSLIEAGISYRLGQISLSDFYQHLIAVGGTRAPLANFPAMAAYTNYVLLGERVDPGKLFEEVTRLETALYDRLAESQEAKALVKDTRELDLSLRLVDFALTPPEWEAYKRWVPENSNLEIFERFYREAEARDGTMAGALQSSLILSKGNKGPLGPRPTPALGILVAGGFHGEGITKRLVNAGIGVITVVPRIKTLDDKPGLALSVFTQDRTPLEKLVSGEKLFLSEPVFDPSRQALTALACAATGAADGLAIPPGEISNLLPTPLADLPTQVQTPSPHTGVVSIQARGGEVTVTSTLENQGGQILSLTESQAGRGLPQPEPLRGYSWEQLVAAMRPFIASGGKDESFYRGVVWDLILDPRRTKRLGPLLSRQAVDPAQAISESIDNGQDGVLRRFEPDVRPVGRRGVGGIQIFNDLKSSADRVVITSSRDGLNGVEFTFWKEGGEIRFTYKILYVSEWGDENINALLPALSKDIATELVFRLPQGTKIDVRCALSAEETGRRLSFVRKKLRLNTRSPIDVNGTNVDQTGEYKHGGLTRPVSATELPPVHVTINPNGYSVTDEGIGMGLKEMFEDYLFPYKTTKSMTTPHGEVDYYYKPGSGRETTIASFIPSREIESLSPSPEGTPLNVIPELCLVFPDGANLTEDRGTIDLVPSDQRVTSEIAGMKRLIDRWTNPRLSIEERFALLNTLAVFLRAKQPRAEKGLTRDNLQTCTDLLWYLSKKILPLLKQDREQGKTFLPNTEEWLSFEGKSGVILLDTDIFEPNAADFIAAGMSDVTENPLWAPLDKRIRHFYLADLSAAPAVILVGSGETVIVDRTVFERESSDPEILLERIRKSIDTAWGKSSQTLTKQSPSKKSWVQRHSLRIASFFLALLVAASLWMTWTVDGKFENEPVEFVPHQMTLTPGAIGWSAPSWVDSEWWSSFFSLDKELKPRKPYGRIIGLVDSPYLVKGFYPHLTDDGSFKSAGDLTSRMEGPSKSKISLMVAVTKERNESIPLLVPYHGQVDAKSVRIHIPGRPAEALPLAYESGQPVVHPLTRGSFSLSWDVWVAEKQYFSYRNLPLPPKEIENFPSEWAAVLDPLQSAHDEKKLSAIKHLMGRYFAYDAGKTYGFDGTSWASTAKPYLERGERIPIVCNTSTLYFYLMARYVGLPAIYVELENSGSENILYRDLSGHAQVVVKVGYEWVVLETTNVMPLVQRAFPLKPSSLWGDIQSQTKNLNLILIGFSGFLFFMALWKGGPQSKEYFSRNYFNRLRYFLKNRVHLKGFDIQVSPWGMIKKTRTTNPFGNPSIETETHLGVLYQTKGSTFTPLKYEHGKSDYFLSLKGEFEGVIIKLIFLLVFSVIFGSIGWDILSSSSNLTTPILMGISIWMLITFLVLHRLPVLIRLNENGLKLVSVPYPKRFVPEVLEVKDGAYLDFGGGDFYWLGLESGHLKKIVIPGLREIKPVSKPGGKAALVALVKDQKNGSRFIVYEPQGTHLREVWSIPSPPSLAPLYDWKSLYLFPSNQYVIAYQTINSDMTEFITLGQPIPPIPSQIPLRHLYPFQNSFISEVGKIPIFPGDSHPEITPRLDGRPYYIFSDDIVGFPTGERDDESKYLTLFNIWSGDRLGEIPIQGMDSIYNPIVLIDNTVFRLSRATDEKGSPKPQLQIIDSTGYRSIDLAPWAGLSKTISEVCARVTGHPRDLFITFDARHSQISKYTSGEYINSGLPFYFGFDRQDGLTIFGTELNRVFTKSPLKPPELKELKKKLDGPALESLENRMSYMTEWHPHELFIPWVDSTIPPDVKDRLDGVARENLERQDWVREVCRALYVLNRDPAGQAGPILRRYMDLLEMDPELEETLREKLFTPQTMPGVDYPMEPIVFLWRSPSEQPPLPLEVEFFLSLLSKEFEDILKWETERAPTFPTDIVINPLSDDRSLSRFLGAARKTSTEELDGPDGFSKLKDTYDELSPQDHAAPSEIVGPANNQGLAEPLWLRELVQNARDAVREARRTGALLQDPAIRMGSYLNREGERPRLVVSVKDGLGMFLSRLVKKVLDPDETTKTLADDLLEQLRKGTDTTTRTQGVIDTLVQPEKRDDAALRQAIQEQIEGNEINEALARRMADAFSLDMTPTSSGFIGIGFFTAFQADEVMVRTGRGGSLHEIKLRTVRASDDRRIVDIQLLWARKISDPQGKYQGTDVQLGFDLPREDDPTFDREVIRARIRNAHFHWMAMNYLSGVSDVDIYWNGVNLRESTSPGATVGEMASVLGSRHPGRLLVDELRIQELPKALVSLVPTWVQRVLTEEGVNIKYPRTRSFVRTRRAIQSPENDARPMALLALRTVYVHWRNGGVVDGLPPYEEYRLQSPWNSYPADENVRRDAAFLLQTNGSKDGQEEFWGRFEKEYLSARGRWVQLMLEVADDRDAFYRQALPHEFSTALDAAREKGVLLGLSPARAPPASSDDLSRRVLRPHLARWARLFLEGRVNIEGRSVREWAGVTPSGEDWTQSLWQVVPEGATLPLSQIVATMDPTATPVLAEDTTQMELSIRALSEAGSVFAARLPLPPTHMMIDERLLWALKLFLLKNELSPLLDAFLMTLGRHKNGSAVSFYEQCLREGLDKADLKRRLVSLGNISDIDASIDHQIQLLRENPTHQLDTLLKPNVSSSSTVLPGMIPAFTRALLYRFVKWFGAKRGTSFYVKWGSAFSEGVTVLGLPLLLMEIGGGVFNPLSAPMIFWLMYASGKLLFVRAHPQGNSLFYGMAFAPVGVAFFVVMFLGLSVPGILLIVASEVVPHVRNNTAYWHRLSPGERLALEVSAAQDALARGVRVRDADELREETFQLLLGADSLGQRWTHHLRVEDISLEQSRFKEKYGQVQREVFSPQMPRSLRETVLEQLFRKMGPAQRFESMWGEEDSSTNAVLILLDEFRTNQLEEIVTKAIQVSLQQKKQLLWVAENRPLKLRAEALLRDRGIFVQIPLLNDGTDFVRVGRLGRVNDGALEQLTQPQRKDKVIRQLSICLGEEWTIQKTTQESLFQNANIFFFDRWLSVHKLLEEGQRLAHFIAQMA